MSRILLPLVPLYAAAVGVKNCACERGWLRQCRLKGPVISVGNLSVGGAGKTPLTIRLAELLCERGIAVDVLSRGYGRRSRSVQRVDPNGSAKEFGDEPLLITQRAHVPVYVGASRYAAGVLAEAETGSGRPRVHLLDDGFQHRRLARDVDIVVLHHSDFSEGLLPAGRLREPFRSLSRAHILAMREEDAAMEGELRRRGLDQPVWWLQRRIEAPEVKKAVAFCAIGRPEEFFAGLRARGANLAAVRGWRDHHRYGDGEIRLLIGAQREHNADAFVTTEKDLVRLTAEQREALERAAPVIAARLQVRIRDEERIAGELLAMLPGLARA